MMAVTTHVNVWTPQQDTMNADHS